MLCLSLPTRNVTGWFKEVNHIKAILASGCFSYEATGEDVYRGTSSGTNYGDRDLVKATFDASNSVTTASEIRPYSIYALPLVAY